MTRLYSLRGRGAACFALLAFGALAVVTSSQAVAQTAATTWPDRTISIISPFPAGGGTDAFARPLVAQLERQLNQRVLIDNRSGAGGTVGASAASKADPNGYNFFIGAAHHTIAATLYPKLDYDLMKDFIPIILIAAPPQVVVVNPAKVSAKTLAELIAEAKANPGKLDYASAGLGTTHHLAGELFQLLAGVKLNHVTYRGAGPAMQDLVAGHVHVMFDGLGSSASQVQGGQIRALAVAAATRSDAIANVPTSSEAGLKGYEVATWYALFAPKGTPPAIVDRMAAEVRKALDTDVMKDIWNKNGSLTPTLVKDDFGKFVGAEIVRWADVINKAGIKLE